MGYDVDWTGKQYRGWRPAVEIAKDVRQDVALAVAEGRLPGDPVKYSVTSHGFSMGQSVDVQVCNWQGDPELPQLERMLRRTGVYTTEAERVLVTLRSILAEHNRERVEHLTDYMEVVFFSDVTYESPTARERRLAKAAERKATPGEPRPDRKGLAEHLRRDHHRVPGRRAFARLEHAHRWIHDLGPGDSSNNHPYESYRRVQSIGQSGDPSSTLDA